MNAIRGLAALAFATTITCASVSAQAQKGPESEVLQAQAERNKAILAQDIQTLDGLLANELVWVHSSARIQNKAEYLEMIRTGSSRWLKLEPQGSKTRVYGDAAVVTGELRQTTTGPGRSPADRTLHTIEVYVRRNGRWLLTDCQATAVPEAKPAAIR